MIHCLFTVWQKSISYNLDNLSWCDKILKILYIFFLINVAYFSRSILWAGLSNREFFFIFTGNSHARIMNSNFFAYAIFLTSVSSCLFTYVSGWRQKCLGNYCSGTHAMKAVCKDGYCVCNSQDYDYNTCLRK